MFWYSEVCKGLNDLNCSSAIRTYLEQKHKCPNDFPILGHGECESDIFSGKKRMSKWFSSFRTRKAKFRLFFVVFWSENSNTWHLSCSTDHQQAFRLLPRRRVRLQSRYLQRYVQTAKIPMVIFIRVQANYSNDVARGCGPHSAPVSISWEAAEFSKFAWINSINFK